MRLNLLIGVLLLVVSVGYGQQKGGFDVRQVRWWMSKQQVIVAEKRKPTEQDKERLVFMNVKVGDDVANLLYEFRSNKLVSLTYTFTKLGGLLYLPYVSYKSIDRKVSERYGEPVAEKERWNGDKNNYKMTNGYADAIENGDLFLSTVWVSTRTEITHVMNADTHGLSYSSKLTPQPASEESKDF